MTSNTGCRLASLAIPASHARPGSSSSSATCLITHTARALHQAPGGKLEILSPFEAVLLDSSMGRLKIERDADLLKSVRYRRWLESLGVEFPRQLRPRHRDQYRQRQPHPDSPARW